MKFTDSSGDYVDIVIKHSPNGAYLEVNGRGVVRDDWNDYQWKGYYPYKMHADVRSCFEKLGFNLQPSPL